MPNPRPPSADDLLRRFATALANVAFPQGWVVSREVSGRSKRGFALVKGNDEIPFVVKVSTAEPAFWGLGFDRAKEVISGARSVLVLLTGAHEGFLITPRRLERLAASFSRSANRPEWKINESKVRSEPRFTTIERLWELLEPVIKGGASQQ